MKNTSRIGAAVGGISIAFSMLCCLIVPVFTGAMVLAALFGLISGGLAMALQARRTAIVAFVFALVPLCEFLLLQYVAEPAGTALIAFIPLVAALAVAVWFLLTYMRPSRKYS